MMRPPLSPTQPPLAFTKNATSQAQRKRSNGGRCLCHCNFKLEGPYDPLDPRSNATPSPNPLLSIPLRAALCRTQMKFRYQTARPGTLRPNALPVGIDLIMFSLCPRAMEPITSNNIHCFSLYTYISLIHACSHSRSILLSRKSQSGTTRPDQGWIAHGGREQTPPGEVIPMRFSSVHCRPDATGVVRGRAHDEYERNTR